MRVTFRGDDGWESTTFKRRFKTLKAAVDAARKHYYATTPGWGHSARGRRAKHQDRYIVTLHYGKGISPTRWSEYGREGNINAVESVDHSIRTGDAERGTVERVLPGGGMKEVYSRSAKKGSSARGRRARRPAKKPAAKRVSLPGSRPRRRDTSYSDSRLGRESKARDKAIQAAINRFPATFGLSHNRGTLYRVSPRIWDHQWNLDKDEIAWLLTEAWVPAGTFKKGEPGHWVDAMKGTPDQLLSIVIEAPKGRSARGRRKGSPKREIGWEASPVTRGETTLQELLDPKAQAKYRQKEKFRGRRARHADGGKAPRTWKQLNKWLLKNGYGYEIVVTRMSEMPAYYGGWHRYVDAVEGHPQPFGETDFWYSSSVYALSPSVKTYDEWVEAIKDLSQGEGGNIWWS